MPPRARLALVTPAWVDDKLDEFGDFAACRDDGSARKARPSSVDEEQAVRRSTKATTSGTKIDRIGRPLECPGRCWRNYLTLLYPEASGGTAQLERRYGFKKSGAAASGCPPRE